MPVLKNPKWDRFAAELANGRTVTDALFLADLKLKSCRDLRRYYIYLLIDPMDDTAFYIGKGKGKRAYSHTKEWRAGKVQNAAKFERISKIRHAGQQVHPVCIIDDISEDDALDTERWFIQTIGLSNLTNCARGENSETAKVLAELKDEMKLIRPFCRWKNFILWQLLRDDKSIDAQGYEALYWDISGEMSDIRAILEGRPYRKFEPMWKHQKHHGATIQL